MRTFVILLVLANLVYLGWHWYTPAPGSGQVRPPTQAAGRTLQLLGEVAGDPGAQAVAPAAAANRTCLALGVFNNTDESNFLISALQTRGLQAKTELIPSGVARTWRVYMPPFGSEPAADQALADLRSRNIDSFRITTGELAGGISLGLFTQENLAIGLQEDLAGQGFKTSIQAIETPRNELWVTIEGISQALLEGPDLLASLSQGLDLDVIEKPCETIASGQ